MSKEKIWAFYAILIIVLGVVGYVVGKKKDKGEVYAGAGLLLGAVLSIILWVTVGKKATMY